MDSCHLHTTEGEYVQLQLQSREEIVRTTDVYIAKGFILSAQFGPSGHLSAGNFSLWLGASYLEWSVCRVFHSVRSHSCGGLPLH